MKTKNAPKKKVTGSAHAASPPPWRAADMGHMETIPGNKSLVAVIGTVEGVSTAVFMLIRNDGDHTRDEDYADPRFSANLALILAAPALREALRDAEQCLLRLPDVEGAYRVTVLAQVRAALAAADAATKGA